MEPAAWDRFSIPELTVGPDGSGCVTVDWRNRRGKHRPQPNEDHPAFRKCVEMAVEHTGRTPGQQSAQTQELKRRANRLPAATANESQKEYKSDHAVLDEDA